MIEPGVTPLRVADAAPLAEALDAGWRHREGTRDVSGLKTFKGRPARTFSHHKEDLMQLSNQKRPTPLPAAPRQHFQRFTLHRPRRLPTPIWTTATARYLQRLQWLFGGG